MVQGSPGLFLFRAKGIVSSSTPPPWHVLAFTIPSAEGTRIRRLSYLDTSLVNQVPYELPYNHHECFLIFLPSRAKELCCGRTRNLQHTKFKTVQSSDVPKEALRHWVEARLRIPNVKCPWNIPCIFFGRWGSNKGHSQAKPTWLTLSSL